jgi:two-component system, OmpR family, manganese sensing sensor histidine kinase
VALRVHLPKPDIKIRCDPTQISQALENLISNAVKYSPRGSSVEIEAQVQGDHVDFKVVDRGIGIPEKDIPHIFKKFYRVDTQEHRRETGTGLGLSIVEKIVHQHGGQVVVASKPGRGSTFSFSLPL